MRVARRLCNPIPHEIRLSDFAMRYTNRLSNETSPYLQQHMHNPVDWFPWGEEALKKARLEAKPILLSVGYSACHWCHVMERESFENPEIAAIMNAHFVSIKVDREERPDIDQIYMNAVQMMTGQGGWPMTVFLTPEGKPFYGGTYYPPTDMYGRPGFPRVLESVVEAWRNRRAEVEEQGVQLLLEMKRGSVLDLPPEPVTPDLLDSAYERIRQGFDARFGGFGGAPKFPQPMILDFLLRYARRMKREEPLRMAEFTLEKMAFGGMYDQLGGGFHRYSTDAHWLVPHFEKMLYDNAQLAHTYLRAYQMTKDSLYRRIVEETLDYVRREMTSPLGGFYSTQDADSEGVEGKFFVWTPQEVKEVLGEGAALFSRFYDVTDRGNFEEKNILNIAAATDAFARSEGMDPADLDVRLAEMRRRLFDRRESRIKPGRDEKIVTSWNGMMMAAFADAGAVLERADYVQTAVNNAEFLLATMVREGRVMRTGKSDDRRRTTADSSGGVESDHPLLDSAGFRVAPIPGFLEDYACLADGLLRLYEATFERHYLERATDLAGRMVDWFADPSGGFFDTATDAETLAVRPKDESDNATPAGNSVAVDVMLRLAVLTGDTSQRNRAADVLRRAKAALERHPQAFGRLLCAADFFIGPVKEIAIVGALEDSETRELIRTVRSEFRPNAVLVAAEPGDSASARIPLLAERGLISGRPAAYVCENYVCNQPVTESAELTSQLAA